MNRFCGFLHDYDHSLMEPYPTAPASDQHNCSTRSAPVSESHSVQDSVNNFSTVKEYWVSLEIYFPILLSVPPDGARFIS